MPHSHRSPRRIRPRGTRNYGKAPMELDALVDLLADRGLSVPDRERALRYLRHIGYYRLSPYMIPFQQDGPEHRLREGTSFDDVLDLYVFDRALRLVVMDALERVEVAVRAGLTDHMSTTYDNPHWYMDASHFRDPSEHAKFVDIVRNSCKDRLQGTPDVGEDAVVHRSALEHYLTTYGSPELPPSWLMVETMTVGQLTRAFRNLERRADQTAVARNIGLTAPLLESWMKTYVRVRNVCAHHGRLWNVGLGVYPAIPNSAAVSWLHDKEGIPERSRKRLYPVLVSFQSILDTVSPHSGWAGRLHGLVSTRPPMNLRGMGIPEAWVDDPFWRSHLATGPRIGA